MRLKESDNLIREIGEWGKLKENLFSIPFKHENNKQYKF
jgi:hypothetical protein